MGYGFAGFGSTGDHYARYVMALARGDTATAATLEQQAYAHTQQAIPDRMTWQAIYDKIEATKAPVAVQVPRVKIPSGGAVPIPLPPPVVTPILPPPPSQLPGGGGGPVVVIPGTPGPTPDGMIGFDDPRGPYVPRAGPSTDGASGGATGGGAGTMGPALAGMTDGLANLVASAKANPAVAIGAVLALFFALKGRGTRRW